MPNIGEHQLKTIVMGLNQHSLSAQDRIISAASCTSNGITPVIDCLHRHFRILQGVVTTIHSAMNDQPVIDAYHHTDLRKTRAAGQSIIPVETGLAQGIGRVLPELDGLFAARALRVPTLNVSAMELSKTSRFLGPSCNTCRPQVAWCLVQLLWAIFTLVE